MSLEEKAPKPDPDDNKTDFDAEPIEAELADSTPLVDSRDDSDDQELVEASIAYAPSSDVDANGAETQKGGTTSFFKDGAAAAVGDANVVVASAAAIEKTSPKTPTPPPLAKNLQNLSANGGAVGALVLGIWCFLGSFITNWSILNGILGLLLGAWGITSRRKRTAWTGIILCTIGILMCLAQFSELINEWWYAVDDTIG